MGMAFQEMNELLKVVKLKLESYSTFSLGIQFLKIDRPIFSQAIQNKFSGNQFFLLQDHAEILLPLSIIGCN